MEVSTVGIIHDLKKSLTVWVRVWGASGLAAYHLQAPGTFENILACSRWKQIHTDSTLETGLMLGLSSLVPSGNGQVPILPVTFSVRPAKGKRTFDLLLLTRCQIFTKKIDP